VIVTYGWLIMVLPSTVIVAVFDPLTGVMVAGPLAGALVGLAGMVPPGVLLLVDEPLPELAGQLGAAGELGVAGQSMAELPEALPLPALPPPPQAESAILKASIATPSVERDVFMVSCSTGIDARHCGSNRSQHGARDVAEDTLGNFWSDQAKHRRVQRLTETRVTAEARKIVKQRGV
jgi:hypothetical protein